MSTDLLHQANAAYVDELYRQFLEDPASVPEDWRAAFESLERPPDAGDPATEASAETATSTPRAAPPAPAAPIPAPPRPAPSEARERASEPDKLVEPTIGVFDLIHSYRELGHLIANLNPLGGNPTSHPLLELGEFGFHDDDLDRTLACPTFGACDEASLHDLIVMLRATYCGTLGIEYMHISDKDQRSWLQERIEPNLNVPSLTADERRRLLSELVRAGDFEQF
ncbi:MAG: hypothetical protein V3R77_05930, partial [Candidatus Binatia bacterium]